MRKKIINLDEVKQLYSEGATAENIANRFRVSPWLILSRLREGGLEVRPTGKHLVLDEEIIKKEYSQDIPISKIAETLNCSYKAVETRLKRDKLYEVHRNRRLNKGSGHWNWRGGRMIKNGYVYIYHPGHPRTTKEGYVAENILVWEEAHGQPLPRGWEVHHFNGVKMDNGPDNLVGLSSKRHRLVIPEFQKRILELETEIKSLEAKIDRQYKKDTTGKVSDAV